MIEQDLQDLLSIARDQFINGDYKQAETALSQILLKNSRIPEVLQMLATIYYDKGQFNKAIKTFQRALEIDPGYTDASVGLSIILNDLGRYEEGKKVFNEAKSILDKRATKTDPFVNEKLANKHEELADLYFQFQRYKEALENLYKALQLSNRRAEITMRIADCYMKMSEWDKAAKELRGIIKEYPNYVGAKFKLGLVFYNMGRVTDAIETWETVLMMEPNHQETLRHLKMAQNQSYRGLSL